MLFLSSHYIKFIVLYFMLGVVFNMILIDSRIRNDKNSYSKFIIYKSIFGTIEPLLTLLILSFKFSVVSPIVVNYVISFSIQRMISVLIFIYLKRECDIQIPKYSVILKVE